MVDNCIVISNVYGRDVIAHLANNRIERIRVNNHNSFPVGTIILGRVKKILHSSNACIVSIGEGVECFLPIPKDISEIIFTDNKQHNELKCEDVIVVQIASEPVKSKPATLTHLISISGRYLVVSSGDGVSYSKKITTSQKKHFVFSDYFQNISTSTHIVVRTEATNVTDMNIIDSELDSLFTIYQDIQRLTFISPDYKVLYKPSTFVPYTIREWLRFGVDKVITDDLNIYNEVCNMCESSHVECKLYNDEYISLSKLYKLESGIDSLLSKRVELKSGAFLIVEQCETLTAIDVNSGHAVAGKKEETIYRINLEAAKEISHILISRNISGMILVDFINMKDYENQKNLIALMKELLSKDDIKAKYIDMTGLGLMEITRQRRNQSLLEQWKQK